MAAQHQLLLLLLLLSACGAAAAAGDVEEVSVFFGGGDEYAYTLGPCQPGAAACGHYENTLDTRGWNYFTVTTSGDFDDTVQMVAAGMAEGLLMHERIYDHKRNMEEWYWEHYLGNVTAWPRELRDLLANNSVWVKSMVAAHPDDPYWAHVGFVEDQLAGLVAGYRSVAPAAHMLTEEDLTLYQALGDILDLAAALKPETRLRPNELSPREIIERTLRGMHCTGYVRLLPDFSDVFLSQDAWFSYVGMNKVFKHYEFALSHPHTQANRFAFSSYPGILFSYDDYYVSDAGMAYIETTNEVANASLYDLVTYKSVLTWTRVRVTGFMAASGPEFADIFKRWNSGTYNNQWLVLDLKQFTPGKRPERDFLWCLEQIPGYIHSADITDHLVEQGYMPSYNIPYFKDVFNMSGYPELVNKSGAFWTYDHCPRANILRRDSPRVLTFDAFKKEMRYNDWQNDPLSLDDPGNAPASRYELKPPGTPRRECFGAMDSKAASYAKLKKLEVDAIGSPTHDQQPVFAFSATEMCKNTLHLGLPDRWDFDWQTFEWH